MVLEEPLAHNHGDTTSRVDVLHFSWHRSSHRDVTSRCQLAMLAGSVTCLKHRWKAQHHRADVRISLLAVPKEPLSNNSGKRTSRENALHFIWHRSSHRDVTSRCQLAMLAGSVTCLKHRWKAQHHRADVRISLLAVPKEPLSNNSGERTSRENALHFI